jgi:phosphate transport system permease protein
VPSSRAASLGPDLQGGRHLLSGADALLVIVALIADMVIKGSIAYEPRFLPQLCLAARRQAGILSAWVGSLLVMLVTACAAVPLGVAAGLYLEEYAKRNWLTDIIEINITNLAAYRRSSTACWRWASSSTVRLRTEHPLRRPDAGAADPADRHRATREAIRAIPADDPRGLDGGRRHPLADLPLPHRALRHARHPDRRDHRLARAIGETAPIITIGALTFIAFLPPVPFTETGEGTAGLFDWLMSPFTVMPIQIFNWTRVPTRPFEVNAAAAGFVLMAMVLSMNAVAIWLRYRLRKNIKW